MKGLHARMAQKAAGGPMRKDRMQSIAARAAWPEGNE